MIKRKPVGVGTGADPLSRTIMPGSFSTPDDIFDHQVEEELYHTPWEAGNDDDISMRDVVLISTENGVPETFLVDVDWRQFDPPVALRKTPKDTPQAILDVVRTSVDLVYARINEERRVEVELKKQRASDASGKGKAVYLPIIVDQDEAEPGQERVEETVSSQETIRPPSPEPVPVRHPEEQPLAQDAMPQLLPKFALSMLSEVQPSQKTRDSALRRLFKRNTERGESSAEGSAREGLLQKLMDPHGSDNSRSAEKKTEAAVAKLKRRLKASEDKQTLLECVSCFEDVPTRDCVEVQCHAYCGECFVRLVSTACENEAQWPPKCCLNEIPFSLIRKQIPSNLKKTFDERCGEWTVPVAERIYCHRADCGLFIKPKRFRSSTNAGFCDRGHWTCFSCRNAKHAQDDCPMDEAMVLTNQIAEEEGWRRCHSCRALVEHAEACQHMTCRCGAQFCYVCGQRWRTCGCTMADLDRVKDQASRKREQKQIREEAQEADAADLRAILRQIEEFEREEARKAALIAEQERKEARERRWRELLARAEAESARVRDVGLRFQQLRESLHGLHDVQLVAIETDREEELEALERDEEETLDQLQQRHNDRRGDLLSKMGTKILAREQAFDAEYKLRLAMEAEVEAAFLKELQDYWADHADGAAQIENSMLSLQRRMDRRFRAWKKLQNEAMKDLRAGLEEERTIEEELMWSATELARSRSVDRRRALAERGVAERKWAEVVMDKRERMLNEMESQELTQNADLLADSDFEDAQMDGA